MRRSSSTTLILASLLALGTDQLVLSDDAPPQDAPQIEGLWQGALQFPSLELRVVFRITRAPDGTLAVAVIRPDQDNTEIAVSSLSFENQRLRFEVPTTGARFDGQLLTDGSAIEGQWTRGDRALPLVLRRVDGIARPRRPQTPEPPYPYHVHDVVFVNPYGPAKLAGTLTVPRDRRPYPAVLLISGGGAQDRDNTILGHRPFLVLADYLTRRGIAVLRVDDRGVGESTGDRVGATSLDFAEDAVAGVAFLKSRPGVDARRIGLIGHSEGGIISPLAAIRSKDVSFVVLLAGPGLPGEQYLDQYDASAGRALGLPAETIAQTRELHRRIYAVLKAEPEREPAEKRLREIFREQHPDMPEPQVQVSINRYLSPWFRFILTHDPAATLERVKCPVLALFGGKDVQVPPERNAAAVRRALAANGNKNSRVEILPSLNHFFQTATTGAPAEYGRIEETFSPEALDVMATWMLER